MLLENVWDYHFDPQTNVIDVHVSRLRAQDREGLRQPGAAHGARRRLHAEGRLMSAQLPAIMRTTAARLSALYLLLFTVCAVPLVFYMTSLSARMLTAQTQETINEEVQGLARPMSAAACRFWCAPSNGAPASPAPIST